MIRRALAVSALFVLSAAGLARAQTGYTITGGLSNFDCHNHCDHDCDEFEIEIEGIHPEDVYHTYRNSNYGTPTVTLSEDGTFTLIDYRQPSHPTAVNSVEHFGVSLRQLSASNVIRVTWYRNGRPDTVNGQVPNPSGSGTTPATQPMLPTISADLDPGTTGEGGVALTVINNDPAQGIWVQRRALVSQGAVTLEALMPSDPVVTTTTVIDAAPFLLDAGQTATLVSDLVEVEDNQSVVFAARYFQDLHIVGPFNTEHAVGAELGNVMTASIAAPNSSCEQAVPVILSQPVGSAPAAGASVDLRVDADSPSDDSGGPLSYQWYKDGVLLNAGPDYSGVTTDGLTVESLSLATEGFYTVRVSNLCGNIESQSALVFIQGHNVPPVHLPPCAVDFNSDGVRTPADIFAFLNLYFAGDAAADFNSDGLRTPADIFSFLNAYFAGC